ncbi:hypothetical protein O181_054201 [Austropuccinia psidii MF-1]|uniref:Uncharacterized protein n=1 Tax=Austropuccinia psidii MF-1 TaxID=1389203 RepID=A0A9Q3E222_9BASI|nr:hypothetical protein [Austropuccinia psidii MF-1]
MIPPHSKDFGSPRDYSLQRETAISWNEAWKREKLKLFKVIIHAKMNLPTPSNIGLNRKPPQMYCIEQFVLTHQIYQELLQWGMADREFKPESHYKDLVESIQNISLKEIFFKKLIIDMK